MQHYIVEFSKYFIAFFMILYTLESFFALGKRRDSKKTGVYIRQNIYTFLIQFFSYLCMCLKTGQIEYLFFYAFLQIALFSTLVLYQMLYPKNNRLILNHMCLLLSIGFIMLTRLDFDKAIKQFFIAAIALIIALIIPFFVHKLRFIKNLKWIYGTVGIFALGIVLVLGQVTHGSKISYTIAGITIQPSEFVKIIFIFFIASIFYCGTDLKKVLLSAVFSGIHIIILVASKDLGSSLIFFIGYLFMLLMATRNYLYFILGTASGVGASVLGYYLFSHVRIRVQAFMDPFSVIDNQGYQMAQSIFAISNGKLFGTGLFNGTPGDIPFVESDFMFSAVAEELGGIFAVCMILICLNCFFVFLRTAMELEDSFYRLAAGGLAVIYIFQIFLTVGGGIKFIPLTGVTLPFVSYGGSSVLTTLIIFAVIQGFHMVYYREEKEKTTEHKVIKKGNREIIFTGCFFSLLFVSMISYYTYYVGENGRNMINNSYNSRQQLLTQKNIRGSIFSAEGEILAETLTLSGGEEYRNYPYEDLFSHVVGFSTKGKTGIEAQVNSYLINSNISLASQIENEAAGRKNPGDNAFTSLRVDLQSIASKSLGVSKGAIIVSNVKTGEILAMVSKPDFNPNTIVEEWDEHLEKKEDSVLLNRATQGIYPPGSTFKIVTSLAYLRENQGNFDDYFYNCIGSYSYEDGKIRCYHGTVHNGVDFISSFAKSCNCSYANMGLGLDRTKFSSFVSELGFNQPLPVDFNYNQSKLQIEETISEEDMIQISFGQGSVQMTPLHLHLITNAIAMGGTPMKPYLVNRIETAEGKVLETFLPESYKAFTTKEEADTLKMMMEQVVEKGTGTRLKGLEYSAAGKTGSAEYNLVKEDSHAWFTGFAPVEDPEISVTIIVERIGSGGDYAVPIAKRLFDAYFGLN